MKKRAKLSVSARYTSLNPAAIALSTGILGAVFVLLTLVSVKYGGVPDPIGIFNFSFAKIIVSVIYGFIDGVIIGALFSWLYNKLNERIKY